MNTFKRTLISLAFLLLVVPGSGKGSDTKGRYQVQGMGLQSCGAFVEARRNRDDSYYVTWLTGYISAVNSRTPTTYSIIGKSDLNGAMLWIENYCKTNPLNNFADAVEALIAELYPKRTLNKAPK